MGEVIKFPTSTKKIHDSIAGAQRVLQKQHELIKHRIEQLSRAERGLTHLEKEYNKKLEQYYIVHGDIPVEYLDYTTNISFTDDGAVVYKPETPPEVA